MRYAFSLMSPCRYISTPGTGHSVLLFSRIKNVAGISVAASRVIFFTMVAQRSDNVAIFAF